MNHQKRPGGLTALAVINFVFCGFGFLGLFGMAALFAFIGMIPTDQMEEPQRAQIELCGDSFAFARIERASAGIGHRLSQAEEVHGLAARQCVCRSYDYQQCGFGAGVRGGAWRRFQYRHDNRPGLSYPYTYSAQHDFQG